MKISLIISIFVALSVSVLSGCGSNTNKNAVAGTKCSHDYDPYTTSLSEDEKKNGKHSSKPQFDSLQDGTYHMVSAHFFVVELIDGKEVSNKSFKAGLSDVVPSPSTSEETFKKKSEDIYTVNDEKHLFKIDCIRNSKQKRVLDFNSDAISKFTIVDGDTSDYEVIRYELSHGLGLDAKFEKAVAESTSDADDMDDFYKGGNRNRREKTRKVYELEPPENLEKTYDKLYEVRAEYKTDDIKIRTRVVYRKLSDKELEELAKKQQESSEEEPSAPDEDAELS